MNSSATTRTLEISGMTGDACVSKIAAALDAVPGVSARSIQVGAATISADPVACSAACTALRAAGFGAHESVAGVRPGTPALPSPVAEVAQSPAGSSPNFKPAVTAC